MHLRNFLSLFLLLGCGAYAQQVNVHGKVADKTGTAVENAIVEIVNLKLKDTTGTDGSFSITKATTAVRGSRQPAANAVGLSLEKNAGMKIEIFDIKGKLLYRELFRKTSSGSYHLNLQEKLSPNHLYIVRASFGGVTQFSTYMPMSHETDAVFSINAPTVKGTGGLARVSIGVDILKVTANGFADTTLSLASYDTMVNVTLPPKVNTSAGCGLTSHLATGTFTEKINGINRRWMLDVPKDYDPNKHYRLIFVWHPLNGSGSGVVASGYNGLKPLSNGTAIFATADGLNGKNSEASGTGWWNADEGDMKLVQVMLDKINNGLCIDQDRIFSTGFSFGGMMSYTLPEVFDVFRAVAPCSGKDDIIQHTDNFTNPVAIMAFHGNADNFVLTRLGKEYLDKYAARNGCETATMDVSPNGCVQYEGCAVPTIWCLFPGAHTTWSEEPAAIWKFFSQF